LATPVCGTLVDSESVDHMLFIDGIAAQGAADLGDVDLGAPVGDGELAP
jgi:hypothetical protein